MVWVKIKKSEYVGLYVIMPYVCRFNADCVILVKNDGSEEYLDDISISGKVIDVDAKKIELIEDENDELHIIVKLYVI